MAKEINYRVNIDTSRAQTDIKDLNDELKETTELSEVDVIINTSKSVQSVGELRRSYRELRDAQLRVGQGTEEFTRLGLAAGELQDKLNGVNEVTKDLAGATSERLVNSFGRIREGIVTLNLDKVNQGFTQLRTTFIGFGDSILKSIPALNGLTGATRTFAAALAATGIGAIVIAVGLLVTNFNKLKDAGGLIGRVFSGLANTFGAIKDGAIDLADALGLIDKAALRAADSVDKLDDIDTSKLTELQANSKALAEELRRLEQQIRANPIADALERAQERVQKTSDAYKKDIAELNKQQVKLVEATGDVVKDAVILNEKLIQLQEQRAALPAAAATGLAVFLDVEIDALGKLISANKEANDAITTAKRIAALERQIIANKAAQDEAKAAEDAERKRLARIEEINKEFALTTTNIGQRRIEARIQAEENKFIKLGKVTQEGLDKILFEEEDLAERALKALDINYTRRQQALEKQFEERLLTEEQYNLRSLRITRETEDARIEVEARIVKARQDVSSRSAQIRQAELDDIIKTYSDEAEKRILLNRLRIAREGEDASEGRLAELDEERRFLELKLEAAEEAGEEELELQRQLKNALIQVETEYQNEVRRLEQETMRKKEAIAAASFQGAQNLTNAIGGLIDTLYANEIAAAEGNFDKQEELRKESFEANKALQIVGAVMTTAQAVVAGLLAGLQMGGPWGIALGAITAAAAAATGAVQIATISATQYTPGTRPSTTSPSAGSAVAGLPSAAQAQPSIGFVGAGIGGSVAGGGAEMPFPLTIETQVSVSETEITSTQGLLSSYEQGAGLGGG
jgi:hypothetical protein